MRDTMDLACPLEKTRWPPLCAVQTNFSVLFSSAPARVGYHVAQEV